MTSSSPAHQNFQVIRFFDHLRRGHLLENWWVSRRQLFQRRRLAENMECGTLTHLAQQLRFAWHRVAED